VLERRSAGMAAPAIAEELKVPQGEVEFILKMATLSVETARKV
jgi:hypothetical protein